MKRPAKNKASMGLLGTIGAAVLGIAAGAAAMFLSEKENRDKVTSTVGTVVKRGKVEVTKAKKKVLTTKKKLFRK